MLALIVFLYFSQTTPDSSAKSLTWLDQKCDIRVDGPQSDGRRRNVWLECSGVSVPIVNQRSLFKSVHVHNVQEALDFARFFTNSEVWYLFDAAGYVDVVPAGRHGATTILSASQLYDLGITATPDVSKRPDGSFSIKRVVIGDDDRVYRIAETVAADGYYELISARPILAKALAHGFIHTAPH